MAKSITPLRAIREKCRECSGGSASEVRECPVLGCPLYPYRDGHNPARRGIGGKCDFSPQNPNSRREFSHGAVLEGSYTPKAKARENGHLSAESEAG